MTFGWHGISVEMRAQTVTAIAFGIIIKCSYTERSIWMECYANRAAFFFVMGQVDECVSIHA